MTEHYPPPAGPHWAGGPQHAAAAPPPKRRKRWPWIAGAGLLLALFIGILADAAGGDDPPTAAPVTAPTETQTWVVQPTTAAPAAAGPRTTFSSGTYEVGTDIQPGKYKTAGPENGGSSCYWARLKNTDGSFDSITANGNAEGPTTVTISKNDAAFESRGCTWTKAG